MGFLGTPLGYIMYWIESLVHNYGLSLILFVLVTKLAMFPLSIKQQKSSARMAAFSKKQKELQKKYKDKAKFQEELSKLYEKEGINPMGGCLPMLIPTLILFGMIDVIYRPLQHIMHVAPELLTKADDVLKAAGQSISASQLTIIKLVQEGSPMFNEVFPTETITQIKDFNMHFLGANLGVTPSWTTIYVLIPLFCVVTGFLTSWISMRIQKKNGQDIQGFMKYTMLFMPLLSLWISFTMPAGAGFYWTISNIFSIGQSLLLQKLWPASKMAQIEDKNADKNREKMRARREKLAAYNKIRSGGASDDTPDLNEKKQTSEEKALEKEQLQQEREQSSKKLAEARKRMAEKYGEEYTED